MVCFFVRRLVHAYLGDALGPGDAGRLRRHCEGCAPCSAALREAQATARLVSSLPRHSLPAEEMERLLERIRSRGQERLGERILGTGAPLPLPRKPLAVRAGEQWDSMKHGATLAGFRVLCRRAALPACAAVPVAAALLILLYRGTPTPDAASKRSAPAAEQPMVGGMMGKGGGSMMGRGAAPGRARDGAATPAPPLGAPGPGPTGAEAPGPGGIGMPGGPGGMVPGMAGRPGSGPAPSRPPREPAATGTLSPADSLAAARRTRVASPVALGTDRSLPASAVPEARTSRLPAAQGRVVAQRGALARTAAEPGPATLATVQPGRAGEAAGVRVSPAAPSPETGAAKERAVAYTGPVREVPSQGGSRPAGGLEDTSTARAVPREASQAPGFGGGMADAVSMGAQRSQAQEEALAGSQAQAARPGTQKAEGAPARPQAGMQGMPGGGKQGMGGRMMPGPGGQGAGGGMMGGGGFGAPRGVGGPANTTQSVPQARQAAREAVAAKRGAPAGRQAARSLDALVRLLQGGKPEEACEAARKLGRVKEKRAELALAKALYEHPDQAVKEAAADALAAIGSRYALAVLRNAAAGDTTAKEPAERALRAIR